MDNTLIIKQTQNELFVKKGKQMISLYNGILKFNSEPEKLHFLNQSISR